MVCRGVGRGGLRQSFSRAAAEHGPHQAVRQFEKGEPVTLPSLPRSQSAPQVRCLDSNLHHFQDQFLKYFIDIFFLPLEVG